MRLLLLAQTLKKINKTKIRKQMTDLMEDQEPVMKGPPFNPVVNLSKLSYEELVRCSRFTMRMSLWLLPIRQCDIVPMEWD